MKHWTHYFFSQNNKQWFLKLVEKILTEKKVWEKVDGDMLGILTAQEMLISWINVI